MEQFVFYLFASVAVISALVVVSQTNAVYSAMALIVTFGSMAVLFFQLGALFIAAIQVIIYAGAIMVLFVFVIMLIDPESEMLTSNRLARLRLFALPASVVLGLLLLGVLAVPFAPSAGTGSGGGDVATIGLRLFRDYLVPFEVTSILILVAVLGAMVLAKKAH